MEVLEIKDDEYSLNGEIIKRISSLMIDCPECETIILDDEQYQCTTCGGGSELNVLNWIKRNVKGDLEEFGRKCFYEGREISKKNENGQVIFKHPTYNGYLRDLKKK